LLLAISNGTLIFLAAECERTHALMRSAVGLRKKEEDIQFVNERILSSTKNTYHDYVNHWLLINIYTAWALPQHE